MDPASAFALACGVIQVVQASFGLLSVAKQLYRKGSIDSVEQLKGQISHFKNLLSSMNARRQSQPEKIANRQELDDLVILAERCNDTAQKLLEELQKLDVSEPHKIFEALKISAKTIVKSNTIQQMKDEMKAYQDTLNTKILVVLWTRLHNLTSEQREGLRSLDGSLKALANTSLQVCQSFESFQALLNSGGTLTLDQILQHQEKERVEQRFLDSLKFPDLIHGQKRVVDAHKETFQWIFDASGQKLGKWSNFVEWLRYGNGIYWVNGKAGSGKSTLMNFVWQNHQTREHLTSWAGPKSLLTPLFFFSVTGTKLQQSVEGLLRSLICQLLEQCRQLIPDISQETLADSSGTQAFSVWTEGKLRHLFQMVIRAISPIYRICMFIDGLDECSGDHRELLGLVCQVANNENTKVCFSSRPEKSFEEFSPSCLLELQDLTKEDMQLYVKAKLAEIPQIDWLSSDQKSWKDRLQRLITERAQGVFLWVELITMSQINGIRDHDKQTALERKLSSLPGDIEELYSRMLTNIDGSEQETALYLQFAYDFSVGELQTTFAEKVVDLHVLNFAIAAFGLTDSLRLSSRLNRRNVVSRCVELSQRIPKTCGGFLELYDDKPKDENINKNSLWLAWEPLEARPTSQDIDWCQKKVRFIHRSATDFFQKDAKGGQFLERHATLPTTRTLWGSSIHLARMKLCNLPEKRAIEDYMLYHVGCLMDIASFAKFTTRDQISQSMELLEYFDKVANKLCRNNFNSGNTPHWSQCWLLPYLERRKIELVNNVRQVQAAVPSSYTPTDLISSAAFWKLGWYLDGIFETECIDAAKSTQLAMCTVVSCGPIKFCDDLDYLYLQWEVADFKEIKTLMGLIRQGANPNCGICTSIWDEVLRFMYGEKLEWRKRGSTDITDGSVAETLQHFLAAGADPDRVLCFHLLFRLLPPSSSKVVGWFDIDTSLLPIIQPREEDSMALSKNSETSNIRALHNSTRPLRLSMGIRSWPGTESAVDIFDFGMTNMKSEDGIETTVQKGSWSQVLLKTRVMTDAQVAELYRLLGNIFHVSKRPQFQSRKWQNLHRPLEEWFQEMQKTFFTEDYMSELRLPEIDPHDSSSEDEDDNDDSDYDD